jgi:hypothetical protein
VVGDQRLGGAELVGEVADAQLLAGEQADDAPAQRVAEGAGDLVAINVDGVGEGDVERHCESSFVDMDWDGKPSI